MKKSSGVVYHQVETELVDFCESDGKKLLVIDDEYDDHHDMDGHIEDAVFDMKQMLKDLTTVDWSKVVWPNLMFFFLLHLLFPVSIFYLITLRCSILTYIYTFFLILYSGFGVTMGAHRLWAHKSYKAGPLLRSILAFGHLITGQESIYSWATDHRTHHKYVDTDADHTNIKRGFFFAHIGHTFMVKHPHVIAARKLVDVSDMWADPVVKVQHYLYYPAFFGIAIFGAAYIPVRFWNEDPFAAFLLAVVHRLFITYHVTLATGSISHQHGPKPYDTKTKASENTIVGPLSLGEGWHNFHHTFPYDYRASEYNCFSKSPSTAMIDWCAEKGLAYDLKVASDSLIRKRMARTGDKSRGLIKDGLNVEEHSSSS